ncbi:MAG: sigma-70 family RNA polymerase sigma factor [Planctomycetota bacterium]
MKDQLAAAVAATQAGDAEAFELIVRTFAPHVRAFLACRCDSASAVDEIAHDTFVSAYEKITEFDPARGEIAPWLMGFARNLALRHLDRRRKQVSRYVDSLVVEHAYEQASTVNEDPLTALEHCLEKLPGRAREVLELRYRRGLPVADLAESLGRTVTWVTTTLGRIRDNLRECIHKAVKEMTEA